MSILEDGKGSGKKAGIDNVNRLLTRAVTLEEKDLSASTGDKYNINTGDITLTDATITSVLYIKNNEDRDLVITGLIYNLGNSTGGSGDGVIDVYRNPTAGTIVTDAVAVDVGTGVSANQNFGSNKTLTVDAYKGDTADNNFTDGSVTIYTRLSSAAGRTVIALGAIVLPKGSSIGISYTPPASNTSQTIQIAAACYLRSDDVTGE